MSQSLQSPLGGVGLTRLRVYDQRPAPDGHHSGCPHVHAICDEAYFVVSGSGYAEFHDLEYGFRTVDLAAGDYLDFPPNVLHRIVSRDHLEILGIMGNAGLAERGEARIYFGPEVDAKPEEYERLATLPKTKGLEGALDRRDAAVVAYLKLLEMQNADPLAYKKELLRFVTLHANNSASHRVKYTEILSQGPARWAETTSGLLENLPGTPVLRNLRFNRPGEEVLLGMCGTLKQVIL